MGMIAVACRSMAAQRLMAEAENGELAEADRDIAAAALNRLYAYATEGAR
jgi:hypothetical protein